MKQEPRAFPSKYKDPIDGDEIVHYGMTLRDYFAAKAMQGVFASERHTDSSDDFFSCSNDWYSEAAGHAYQMADAMLKAREQ